MSDQGRRQLTDVLLTTGKLQQRDPRVRDVVWALQGVEAKRFAQVSLLQEDVTRFVEATLEKRRWIIEYYDNGTCYTVTQPDLASTLSVLAYFGSHEPGFAEFVQWVEIEQRSVQARAILSRHKDLMRETWENAVAQRRTALEMENVRQLGDKSEYLDARRQETAELNERLKLRNAALGTIWSSSLNTHFYMDLEAFKRPALHPPFDPGALAIPLTPPPTPTYDPYPEFQPLVRPQGVAAVMAYAKWKKQQDLAALQHKEIVRQWEAKCAQLHARWQQEVNAHNAAEIARVRELQQAEQEYKEEYRLREAKAAARNEEISALIHGLSHGNPDAVQEYVRLLLTTPEYPQDFKVSYESSFDHFTGHLRVKALVPTPAELPTVRDYRYVISRDDLTASEFSTQEQCERYERAVTDTTVRILNDVLQYDARELVQVITLELGVEHPNPTTGHDDYIRLTALSVTSADFLALDVARLGPKATLSQLQASVSADIFGLLPVPPLGARRREAARITFTPDASYSTPFASAP